MIIQRQFNLPYGIQAERQFFFPYGLTLSRQWSAFFAIQVERQWSASYRFPVARQWSATYALRVERQWVATFSVRVECQWSMPYRLPVEKQWGLPFAIRVERQWSAPYRLPVVQQWSAPYAVEVERQWQASFRLSVDRQWSAFWADHAVVKGWSMPWQRPVTKGWTVPIHFSVGRSWSLPYTLRLTIQQQWSAPYSGSITVSGQWRLSFDLKAWNPVDLGWRFFWDLLPSVMAFDATAEATMDHPGSSPVRLLATDIGIAEGEYAWTGRMEVASIWNYQRLAIDDPITLSVGGEAYSLLIDNRTLSHFGGDRPRMEIAGISPSAMLASPRATPFEKTWNNAVQAREACEEAVGMAIDWQLLDWLIPAGRLSVYNAAPLEVVRTIAKAAGGVVETKPDGTLRVRHLFPVPVPEWQDAIPDHVLTDVADNLSITESHRFRKRINRVSIRDYLPTTGHLSAELDDRAEGLNLGRTSFTPGSTAHFLVNAGQGVTVTGVNASGGSLFPGARQLFQMTEDLVFSGSNQARLSKPARSLDAWIWMGRNLGGLTLESDSQTITASNAGLAMVRIKYSVETEAWGLSSPNTLGGENAFPIQVQVTAADEDNPGSGEAIFQRGSGQFPGEDISEPLLSGLLAKQSRGRAEIDAGEELQEISLTCVHRPGIMPGDLAEVHDALMGKSWRGKVVGVSHSTQGPVTTTSLDLVRRVPVS